MSLGLNAQENECAFEVQEGGGNAWVNCISSYLPVISSFNPAKCLI